MRRLLLVSFILISGISFAGNTEPSLTIDSTGRTTICFPKDSTWFVNLEQYRWNKWVFVKHVEFGRILDNDTCVSFDVDIHSGENVFRLNKYHGSRSYGTCCRVTLISRKIVPEYKEQYGGFGQGDTIKLPYKSMWEIYDHYGNLVWKGNSKEIPARGLEEGDYYLCYDNSISIMAVYHEEHRKK